jgi:2-polyprenyl-6-hydroxyphenyl methylase/3-demethylubiquinone-9 3-methyltransferase
MNVPNIDPQELAKFEALAAQWWDPKGDSRALHDMNPLRLDYIDARAGLAGKTVLDIGCGGGILAEAMALRGAEVTGIDMSEAPLNVARLHLAESGASVDYRHTSAETLAAERAGAFDVVTCMEMLEHVPDPAAIVQATATLLKNGGHAFFSTINRNSKAYAFAILGAEYVLGLLPRGTHDYAKFIRPSELDGFARAANLTLADSTGLHYNPLTRAFHLGDGLDVNYFMHFRG